jgi:hypothetical protein
MGRSEKAGWGRSAALNLWKAVGSATALRLRVPSSGEEVAAANLLPALHQGLLRVQHYWTTPCTPPSRVGVVVLHSCEQVSVASVSVTVPLTELEPGPLWGSG